jgi:dihydroorotate dehydrogenase electron transfer subunit
LNVAGARVVEVSPLGETLYEIWFDCPEVTRLAHPGQFLMVQCGEGEDPFLPRPFSYCRSRGTEPRSGEHALLVQVAGRGSEWLARRAPGDVLNVVGPLGTGVSLLRDTRHLLLVGHGVRVAPLLFMAEVAVARDVSVTLIQGSASGQPTYPPDGIPPEVELEIVPSGDDERGIAHALPEYLRWADQIVVAAGEPLLRQVAADLKTLMLKPPAQAIVWAQMACGTGACSGCAIETRRHGSRLVCRDGPRFDLRELY